MRTKHAGLARNAAAVLGDAAASTITGCNTESPSAAALR